MDEYELWDSKYIDFCDLKDEKLQKCCQPSNFCLITSNGHKHGPFGTHLLGRKPVTVSTDNGNVLAQAALNFIYPDDNDCPIYFSNEKCFSFLVSFRIKQSRVK